MIWLLFGRAIASRSFDHVGFDECFDVDLDVDVDAISSRSFDHVDYDDCFDVDVDVDVDVDAIASRSFDHMDYDDCFDILRIEDNERAIPV